jgi:hypothetical protein
VQDAPCDGDKVLSSDVKVCGALVLGELVELDI